MIDSRVNDAFKQQAQKIDWLLTEAAVGDDKVGLLLPEDMAPEIPAQDTASVPQTGDHTRRFSTPQGGEKCCSGRCSHFTLRSGKD